MANITLGTSTTSITGMRTTNAMAFRNTTNGIITLSLFRNVQLGANSSNCPPGITTVPVSAAAGLHPDFKYMTFADADGYLERGPKTNAMQAYLETGSTENYFDDVNELCAQIVAGNLVTYSASAAWAFNNPKKGPITFTLLASASPTIFGDGSISYF